MATDGRGLWEAAGPDGYRGGADGRRKEVALRLRYLERVPLGTPYPDIVERVRRTTRAPELDGRCHVAVDLPRRAGLGATILPAIITGGAAESLNKG